MVEAQPDRQSGHERCQADGDRYYSLAGMETAFITYVAVCDVLPSKCLFKGVNVSIVVPSEVPINLRTEHPGMLLKRVGGSEDLVQHCLKQHCSFDVAALKRLCTAYQAKPKKNKKGKLNKREYEVALYQKVFGEEEGMRVLNQVAEKGKAPYDGDLAMALEGLDEDNKVVFKELENALQKAQLEAKVKREIAKLDRKQRRPSGPRAKGPRVHKTPEDVKRTGLGGPLYINPASQSYLAQHDYGRPFNTRRATWGKTTGRTKEQAKSICLKYLREAEERRKAALSEKAETKRTKKAIKVERKKAKKKPRKATRASRTPSSPKTPKKKGSAKAKTANAKSSPKAKAKGKSPKAKGKAKGKSKRRPSVSDKRKRKSRGVSVSDSSSDSDSE